jgi:hypothetical protein
MCTDNDALRAEAKPCNNVFTFHNQCVDSLDRDFLEWSRNITNTVFAKLVFDKFAAA